MAESDEELKSLLMKVKEESEKVGLKLNTAWIGFSGHMGLFRASQLWEAGDVLNCLNTDSFE